eukprot:EG_transcript_9328
MAEPPRHVVVLGGGLAGLATAYYLREVPGVRVTVLEATAAPGGWCRTLPQPGPSWMELGPRSFRGANGLETLRLVHELGLQDDLLLADRRLAAARFVVDGGKLLRMGPLSALRKIGLWNLLLEPFRPRGPLSIKGEDESVFAFAERRFGPGLATLLSAVLTGIYAGDATQLSVRAVFPFLAEMEDRFGSVLLGCLCSLPGRLWAGLVGLVRGRRTQSVAEVFAQQMKRRSTVFTFRHGLGQLPERLAQRMGAELRLGCTVTSLDLPGPLGEKTKVTVHAVANDGAPLDIRADHVISTLPAWALADVLQASSLRSSAKGSAPAAVMDDCARLLRSIPFASVAAVSFGLEAPSCPWARELDGFGFLAPPSEGAEILGALMESRTFPDAQPDSLTRITVLLGQEAQLQQTEGCLVEVAQRALEQYLGLGFRTGQSAVGVAFSPLWVTAAVHRRCIPQYVLGHRRRVARLVEVARDSLPQLTLAGQSFHGVGINDTIRLSREAVLRLKDEWG